MLLEMWTLNKDNWEQHSPFTKKELKENKKMHKTNEKNVVTMVSMKGEWKNVTIEEIGPMVWFPNKVGADNTRDMLMRHKVQMKTKTMLKKRKIKSQHYCLLSKMK
jgi:hypothetical protein